MIARIWVGGRLRAMRAGVVPLDLRELPIDLLAFPGHKSLLGPTGTGALYVGPRAKVGAWREGGTGGDSASETQPRELPYFLEGGTPNVLGVAGLAAGVRYVPSDRAKRQHPKRRRRKLTTADVTAILAAMEERWQVYESVSASYPAYQRYRLVAPGWIK